MRIRYVAGLSVAVLMVGLSSGLQAQGGPPPGYGGPQGGVRSGPPTPQAELQRMTLQLTLTEAQQAAILPILLDRQAKMQALRKDGTSATTQEADMQQRRVILDATNAQIRALLTETQAAMFDKMQPRGPMGGGQQVPGGAGTPDTTGQPPDPK